MGFYAELLAATVADRDRFSATPVLRDGAGGRITRAEYLAFLGEAYHHVRHTVPLLMACGARLP